MFYISRAHASGVLECSRGDAAGVCVCVWGGDTSEQDDVRVGVCNCRKTLARLAEAQRSRHKTNRSSVEDVDHVCLAPECGAPAREEGETEPCKRCGGEVAAGAGEEQGRGEELLLQSVVDVDGGLQSRE
jgi:hypothetical protein